MFSRQVNLAFASALIAVSVAGCTTVSRMDPGPAQDAAKNAREAFKQNRFQDAIDGYMKAIALSEQSNPAVAAKLKVSLAEVYREWSISVSYSKKGENTSAEDYYQAIKLCSIASDLDPARKKFYDEMIANFQGKISLLKYRAIHKDETLIPDFKPLQEKLDIFLTQGRAYVLAGDYSEAKKHFEKVLAIDPGNAEATRELSNVIAKIAKTGETRAGVERASRIAEVSWKRIEEIPPSKPSEEQAKAVDHSPSQTSKFLHDTVIPKLDLRQTPLKDAFSTLETEAAWNGKVSFLFVGFDPSSKEWPLINFSAEKISLAEALSSLCDAVGLTYAPGPDGNVSIFRKP